MLGSNLDLSDGDAPLPISRSIDARRATPCFRSVLQRHLCYPYEHTFDFVRCRDGRERSVPATRRVRASLRGRHAQCQGDGRDERARSLVAMAALQDVSRRTFGRARTAGHAWPRDRGQALAGLARLLREAEVPFLRVGEILRAREARPRILMPPSTASWKRLLSCNCSAYNRVAQRTSADYVPMAKGPSSD